MEESKCNHITIIQFLLFLLLIILAILFFWEAEKPMRDKVCVERTQMVIPIKITPKDSITMQEYSQRLDSIQHVLEDVRSQYQAEINIGIDRLNAWVGFWLAILSLILLLAGIKQYLDSRNYEEKWKKIEEEYLVSNLEIYELITKEIPKENVLTNESMKKHTSFKIGGNADFYVRAKNIEEIKYYISNRILTVQIVDFQVRNYNKINGIQMINLNSPLAKSIIGKSIGDLVRIDETETKVEIIDIELA